MEPKSFIRGAVHALVAIAAGCSCVLAIAQAKTYRVQATFDDWSTRNEWVFIEAFGNDRSYLQLDTFSGPLTSVASRLNYWLMPQLSAVGTADLQLSYDRSAPMTAESASGRTAYYNNAASAITGNLVGVGGSQSLNSGATSTAISRNTPGTAQAVHVRSANDWLNGPLAGNDFALSAPMGTPFLLDLKAEALNSWIAPTGALAGILGLDSLQVRLTSPQTFAIHAFDLYLARTDPTAHFDNQPIDFLSATDFDQRSVLISFSARFGVSVDRADYTTDAAFNAARDWVNGNLRQIDYDMEANFVINSVTEVLAVPEPAVMWLMVSGLGLLAWRARRRVGAK